MSDLGDIVGEALGSLAFGMFAGALFSAGMVGLGVGLLIGWWLF